MRPLLIYCYDAYCGWCYGFSPVIRQFAGENKKLFQFEVLSGGMILPEKPAHISSMAGYIRKAYNTVEERTGIRFGQDYLWHIFNPDESDWYPDSMKPAVALSIFKDYHPDLQVEFAADLQYGHHFEGRDLTDNEAYRHLLDKYHIPEAEFYQKLAMEEFADKARYEFSVVKQLQVTGFPTVLIQAADNKFYVVARGYATLERLKKKVQDVHQSITSSSSL